MTDKNNKIPFEEDNYTHNINRNNERKLDRRGFMKTLVGAAGVFAVQERGRELSGVNHRRPSALRERRCRRTPPAR